MAFGRMKHEDDSSHDVLVGVNEMAMRLRETTSAIAGALELLKDQGRAEERAWADVGGYVSRRIVIARFGMKA